MYDMHGNVYEWCTDWFDFHPKRSGSVTDPTGPSCTASNGINTGIHSPLKKHYPLLHPPRSRSGT
ncbi:MAG: SUMF1/EgtB/PvdO family nonheme iron enzyme [Planctomycetaceae bacterium]